MAESIGTARLDIVVDTSQFDAAIATAKSRVSGMSAAAQAEYAKLNSAERRRIDNLVKQADTLGFTRQQQILYNAALKNTPTAVLDDLKRKLGSANQETVKLGVSAKQTAAAMRGVPAQLTDIFTSLQGGQNPLTVLFQQGGQLKDMFGGVTPAARALGGQLLALVTPATAAAAAFAAFAAALIQSENRAEAFNTALVTSGNKLRLTVEDMDALSESIANLDGVTRGGADEALTRVASGGKIAADQLQKVAEAAALWSKATGQSVDEIVSKFEDLAKDPLDAILKLNEAENFLTQAQLERIQTLKEEGREQEAARIAIDTYADTLVGRAPQVIDGLGNIKKGWSEIREATSAAWTTFIGFADYAAGAYQRLIGAQREFFLKSAAGISASANPITRLRTMLGAGGDFVSSLGSVLDEPAKKKGGLPGVGSPTVNSANARKAIKEREEAERRWGSLVESNLSKQQKLESEITKIRADGRKLRKSDAEIERQVTQARARYAESLPKGGKGRSGAGASKTDPTEAILRNLRQQIALNEAAAASEGTLTSAERLRVQVEQQLAELGGKVTPARRAEINALLDQAVASEKAAEATKNEAKAKEELARLTNQLTAAEAQRKRLNDLQIQQVGLGEQEVEKLRRRLDIEQEYVDGLKQLRDKGVAEGSESYIKQELALRESRDRMLAGEEEFWRRMLAAQGNWANGANKAFADYIAEASDIAGQTEAIFRNAFQGLEDVLVDFFTKGKADWRGFLDSVAADITRFIIKQQLSKWLKSLGENMGGGSGNWLSSIASAIFGGGTNANGNAFAGGNVIPFAKGGVISSPMNFPMSGGRVGLMGEAGPEAIVPLKRGPDGKLGVRMERERDAPGAVTQVFNTHIQGRMDRTTEEQFHRRTGREAARGMARTGR